MEGVKSKRGGARPNSGGARPGAGRPPKEPEYIHIPECDDPLVFLTSIMKDDSIEARIRIDAAKALMPFKHKKLGESGKKEEKQNAALASAAGRFGLRSVK